MLHQTAITDPLTGAQFNDYEILDPKMLGYETEDTKFDYGTQVCAKHTKQYKMADGLDKGMGAGKCGGVGCEKPAVHLYHFMVPGTPIPSELRVARTPVANRTVVRTPKRTATEITPTSLKGVR